MVTIFTKKSTVLGVILNFNNSAYTLRLLDCLEEAGIDIFLLDNASDEADRVRLEEGLSQQKINLEYNRGAVNKGFGGGVNCGLTFAAAQCYDFVVLLNNDLMISDVSIFSDCVDACKADAVIGCVGVEHRRDDHSIESLGGGVVYPALGWGRLETRNTAFLQAKRGYVMGSFFFLPVSVVRSVGLFDERFFIYFEEADYCFRLKLAGHTLTTIENKHVIHAGSATYGGKPSGFYERYSVSSSMFVRKWYGGFCARVAFILSVLGSFFVRSRRSHIQVIIRAHLEGLSS